MNAVNSPMPSSQLPHKLAVLLACATFPLIWVGGLVTTYDAGMAVPDWPSTFGYNLFLYPWQTWISGPWNLFIEHGHRLLGALVGFITIGFMISVFCLERRLWMRVLAITALVAVIFQGALGGVRVLLDDRQVAMIHGCFGPAFFAFVAALVAFTSRRWTAVDALRAAPLGKIHRLAVLTPVMAYVQLVIGATLRHLPIDVTPSFFQTAVLFHLLFAAAVFVHALLLAREVRRDEGVAEMRLPALGLVVLVTAQVLLGVATWVAKYNWPSWFAEWSLTAGNVIQEKSLLQSITVTAHMAMGSLILALSVFLSAFVFRLRNPWVAESPAARHANANSSNTNLYAWAAEGSP